jgi:cytochrome c oxidase cbb3-type subunit 4
MFKYIQQYAESIANVGVYPIISLLIFFLFFVVLVVMVKRMKKDRVAALSRIPLDDEEITSPIL